MKIKECKISSGTQTVVDVNELLTKLEYIVQALKESEATIEHLKFYEMFCDCYKVIKAINTQNKVLHETLIENKREIEVLKEVHRVEQSETKPHFGCFGKYDENDFECCFCPSGDKCLKETENITIKGKIKLGEKENKLPECFGKYEEENSWNDDCDECEYVKYCKEQF